MALVLPGGQLGPLEHEIVRFFRENPWAVHAIRNNWVGINQGAAHLVGHIGRGAAGAIRAIARYGYERGLGPPHIRGGQLQWGRPQPNQVVQARPRSGLIQQPEAKEEKDFGEGAPPPGQNANFGGKRRRSMSGYGKKKRFLNKRKRDYKKGILQKKLLNSIETKKLYQLDLSHQINVVDSAQQKMFYIGCLNDYVHIREHMDQARKAGPAAYLHNTVTTIDPLNYGTMNVNDSTYLCNNELYCKLTNVGKYDVVVDFQEIGFHRDMGRLNGDTYAANPVKVTVRNLMETLNAHDDLFVDSSVSGKIVWQNGSTSTNGPDASRLNFDVGCPIPWAPVKPWIYLGKKTNVHVPTGESCTYKMVAKDVHFVPQLMGSNLNPVDPLATSSRVDPDNSTYSIPVAYRKLTKILFAKIRTENQSVSASGLETQEAFEGGSYRVVAAVHRNSKVKTFLLKMKTTQVTDERPDITSTADERQVVDAQEDLEGA